MELNKVLMIGNLGHSPSVRDANGTKVAKFNICSNRRSKDSSGEQQQEACWMEVVVFGKTAEICERYLQKGSQVLVEGRIKQETWDDKDTNKKRSKHVIVADRVQFGAKPKEGDGEPKQERPKAPTQQSMYGGGYTPPQPAQYDDPGGEAQGDDDLPF